jgi:hypothetical protein
VSRNYRSWLQAYLEYAKFSEAPTKMHFWTGVSCIAGALRRQVWIDEAYFEWTPNFYIIFVAPPGIVSKSSTASIGMNLLRDVPGTVFGPQSITWQALLQSLSTSTQAVEFEPGIPTPMSAVTFSVGELGTFLDPQNREMIDVLTGLWDGQKGVFDKVTKTQGGDEVQNPWVNILACTTPQWLQANLTETAMGGGLAARIIWVYGDKKERVIAYPSEHIPPDFGSRRQALLEDLCRISTLKGVYHLTPEARKWGRDWYDGHVASVLATPTSDAVAGYLARKQTHLHKLAMILAAAESDELLITEKLLVRAEKALRLVEVELHKVYDALKATQVTRVTRHIIDLLHQREEIDLEELYRGMMATMEYEEFKKALQGVQYSGAGTVLQSGNRLVLRRKSPHMAMPAAASSSPSPGTPQRALPTAHDLGAPSPPEAPEGNTPGHSKPPAEASG